MGVCKRYMHIELNAGGRECHLDNERIFIAATKVDGSNGCVRWDEGAGWWHRLACLRFSAGVSRKGWTASALRTLSWLPSLSEGLRHETEGLLSIIAVLNRRMHATCFCSGTL